MKIQDMCDINFNGKFIEPKISKKAYKAKNMLQDILHTKIDNKSNTELIKNLPFDVYIYCKNPTRKSINPHFSFLIETEETPKQIGLCALKHLRYSEGNNAEKLRNFLLNFNSAYIENLGVLPLKDNQKNTRLAELIISGFFNK